MTKVPEFQVAWLDEPPEVIGKLLLGRWIAYQAERSGLDPSDVPESFATRLVEATADSDFDTDELAHQPLLKALRLAARGEFARAGSLCAESVRAGATQIVNERFAARFVDSERARFQRVRKGGRTSMRDGTRKPRGAMAPLIRVGNAVYAKLARGGRAVTLEQFELALKKTLAQQLAAFRAGEVATYPFKDKNGNARKCPRQTLADYLKDPSKLPAGLR